MRGASRPRGTHLTLLVVGPILLSISSVAEFPRTDPTSPFTPLDEGPLDANELGPSPPLGSTPMVDRAEILSRPSFVAPVIPKQLRKSRSTDALPREVEP